MVDKDEDLLAFASGVVEDQGHVFFPATTLRQGEHVCQSDKIDVVFVAKDMAPAGQLGPMLAQCHSELHSVVLVIDDIKALSDYPSAEQWPLEDYLIKPFSSDELQARLRMLGARRVASFRERSLLTAIPDLIFRVAEDGTYLDFYAPNAADTAMPPDRFLGQRLTEVLPAEVATVLQSALERTIAEKKPREVEYQLALPMGKAQFEARLVPSGSNEALVIVRNITEQRRLQDSVTEQLRFNAETNQAFAKWTLQRHESERQHVARELHERIGQQLMVHRMDAEFLARQMGAGGLRDAADALCGSLDDTLRLVRDLALGLRPPILDELGVGSALMTLVTDIDRRSGIRCECTIEPRATKISGDASVALYRIAQEALTNAVRHSNCDRISLTLQNPEHSYELQVKDNGVGIDPVYLRKSSSLGLIGMRERARLFGGTVSIEPIPGSGTIVCARIPEGASEVTQ